MHDLWATVPYFLYIILSGEQLRQCCSHLHEIKEMYESNVRRFIFSRCMFCDFVHIINCLYVHLLLSTAAPGNSFLVEVP